MFYFILGFIIYLLVPNLYIMIVFNKVNYKTRSIETSGFGNVKLSVRSLNDVLIDEKGEYVSENARLIDEEIFYFVEDDQIGLPSERLQELLKSEII